ncbi:MAG: DUF4126 domain-containing protein [Thermodesulfobacteriota bacterium]
MFIPLLVMSIASSSGHITVSENLSWISTYPAIIALSVASLLEISAYLIPFVDNLLDVVAGPAAVVAGTLVTASFITEMSPFMKWAVAIIAGGGVAGSVQAVTTMARASSTAMTAGLANSIISAAEAGTSLFISILSITFPVIAFFSVAALIIYCFIKLSKRFLKRRKV